MVGFLTWRSFHGDKFDSKSAGGTGRAGGEDGVRGKKGRDERLVSVVNVNIGAGDTVSGGSWAKAPKVFIVTILTSNLAWYLRQTNILKSPPKTLCLKYKRVHRFRISVYLIIQKDKAILWRVKIRSWVIILRTMCAHAHAPSSRKRIHPVAARLAWSKT